MSNDVNDVILVEDRNVDIVRNNAHIKCLCDILARHGLYFGKSHQKANYQYTYYLKELISTHV